MTLLGERNWGDIAWAIAGGLLFVALTVAAEVVEKAILCG